MPEMSDLIQKIPAECYDTVLVQLLHFKFFKSDQTSNVPTKQAEGAEVVGQGNFKMQLNADDEEEIK